MKKTKIICSIGPASYDPDVMEQMVLAGMNVARINFSHATEEEKIKVLSSVKEVRKRTGLPISIMYDTKGPEFRSGLMENDGITLVAGKTVRVVKEVVIGNNERFSVNFPEAIDHLEIGNIILLENGLMKIEVISVEEDGVTCLILSGGIMGSKKSLNAPGVDLSIPFISKQDREDLIYACENEGDFIALSFVNTAKDVLEAKEIFKKYKREDLKIISKIESMQGIQHLDEITKVSDGIMVARGDLGVEVPLQDLPYYQKLMAKRCRAYGKVCIVATEMLESMKKNIRPTRAEVSDIANAILDGTDAVMLSGESTTGLYPIETVSYMAKICESTERYYDYDKKFLSETEKNPALAIAHGVLNSEDLLDIKLNIALTQTGYSVNTISNLRPKKPVLAICPKEEVARSLTLNWGVYPITLLDYNDIDKAQKYYKQVAKEMFNLKKDDQVTVVSGLPFSTERNKTNSLKIDII